MSKQEQETREKQIEEIRKKWEDRDFQQKQAQAREQVRAYLEELNKKYQEKKSYPFLRYLEDRLKSPESIWQKLDRKAYKKDFDTALEKLNDISGVRVICYCVDDIYWIAKQISRDKKYQIIKFKDFVIRPKKCGYQSYHIVLETEQGVKVEVQLRTMAMDAWAGLDNQIRYKKDSEISPETLKQIRKYSKMVTKLDQLIAEIRKGNL